MTIDGPKSAFNNKEFIIVSTGETYNDAYNIGPDGKYYTGNTYIFGVSKLLEINNKKTSNQYINIDNEVVQQYISLNESNSKKHIKYPKAYYPQINSKDYQQNNFIIQRYFARKSNDINSPIVEIDEKQFKNFLKDSYYKVIQISWKITGYDIESFNNKQINDGNNKLKGLNQYLTNVYQLAFQKKSDI